MEINTMHTPKPLFQVRDPLSALTHFIALLAAVFSTPLILVHAAETGASKLHLVSLSIFMVSMILLYGASSAYHTFSLSEDGIRRLKKLDHTMIFFLIAGSYTPVCVITLGASGKNLLILVWTLAIAGAILGHIHCHGMELFDRYAHHCKHTIIPGIFLAASRRHFLHCRRNSVCIEAQETGRKTVRYSRNFPHLCNGR